LFRSGKAQESDALAINLRLRSDKTDCVPECLHPQREIAHDGWIIGRFDAGTVKIVKQVHRESLGREHACILLNAGDAATSAVDPAITAGNRVSTPSGK